MKRYSTSIILLFICFSFLFTSCEKKETKSVDMHYTYLLTDLEALLPIDLNFDGIENVDLSKEIDAVQYYNPLSCSVSFSTGSDTLTIAWIMPDEYYDPMLVPEITYTYTGDIINYSIVKKQYTYVINHDKSMIYLEETDNSGLEDFYSLWGLTALIIDKEQNTIGFPFSFAGQYFLTRDGIKPRGLRTVFKPYPEDNYLK